MARTATSTRPTAEKLPTRRRCRAHFVKADNSLEELAEKLGIDAAGLAAEIATFNENAAKGVDPVYHRGEKHLDINTTGVMAGSRTDLANPVLAPLATGPVLRRRVCARHLRHRRRSHH